MKSDLIKLIEKAIPISRKVAFEVSRTKSEKHGHWTSNVAMILAKEVKKNPREIASQIISDMPKHKMVEKIEVAGPGFINFFLTEDAYLQFTKELLKKKDGYFPYKEKKPKKILIEYVSANPTGPLHIGHGRGAAFGSALSNLLIKAGNKVTQEYYVNDAGNQIQSLKNSVWLRYLELLGISFEFPSLDKKVNKSFFYQGEYIKGIAKQIFDKFGYKFLPNEISNILKKNSKPVKSSSLTFKDISWIDTNGKIVIHQEEERKLDTISNLVSLMYWEPTEVNVKPESSDDGYVTAMSFSDDRVNLFEESVISFSLKNITNTLKKFRVNQDNYFSEMSLYEDSYRVPKNLRTIELGLNSSLDQKGYINKIEEVIYKLKDLNLAYVSEGAIWFKSTSFGDSKDRVLCKSDPVTTFDVDTNRKKTALLPEWQIWEAVSMLDTTYFVPDIAYHESKFQRGYDQMLDIFGADHHGYLPRLKGALNGLGYDVDTLKTVFIQFANLFKDGEKTSMSTRAGEFVDLDKLIEEVGVDATRFFFLAKKGDQTLDFDLDLAVSEDKNNPVYYIQYAYARICSLEAELKKRKLNFDLKEGIKNLKILNGKTELEIIKMIDKYPDLIEQCVKDFEIHPICFYLRDLAAKFHSFYTAETIIEEDVNRTNAKFALLLAIKKIISGGMEILSVSTPEKM